MSKAAGMVTELFEPDFVDINFGCPVKKVVKSNGGSGCLKDMTLVRDIIGAVQSATRLPVTVKIRSGWDEAQRDPVTIALRCQDAGARAHAASPNPDADVPGRRGLGRDRAGRACSGNSGDREWRHPHSRGCAG